jgi:hypothetical protein
MNSKVELERNMHAMLAQGQGVWHIEIIFPWSVPRLHLRRAAGDEQAARLLSMLEQTFTEMRKCKPPALCLLCDHTFRKKHAPAAFVVLYPAVDDPHNSVISPLCHPCAEGARLPERVTQKLREGMIPDLRVLAQPSAVGSA